MSNDNHRWHPENDDWADRNGASEGNAPNPESNQGNYPNYPNNGSGNYPNPSGENSGYPSGNNDPGNSSGTNTQGGGGFGYFGHQSPSRGPWDGGAGNDDRPSTLENYGQFGASSGNYGSRPYGGYSGSPFPLHPLTTMEQIDAAIRLIRYNPKVFVVLPLIVYLIAGIVSTIIVLIGGEASYLTTSQIVSVDADALSTSATVSTILTALVSFIAGLFIYTTAVNAAMSAVYGRKITIGRAISMSTGDAGRLGVAYILYVVAMAIIMTLISLLFIPFGESMGGGGVAILALLLLIGSIYFAVRLSCVVPALVAEQRGPIASIARSFQLTSGMFFQVFATFFVAVVLSIVLMIAASIVIAIFSFLGMGTTTGTLIYATITSALISAVSVAFFQAVTNVIYINLRMVREGFHGQVRDS